VRRCGRRWSERETQDRAGEPLRAAAGCRRLVESMVRAIVVGGQPQAARAAGVCPRTARNWVDRFRTEGLAGLADRSSRPQRLRQPTSPAIVDQEISETSGRQGHACRITARPSTSSRPRCGNVGLRTRRRASPRAPALYPRLLRRGPRITRHLKRKRASDVSVREPLTATIRIMGLYQRPSVLTRWRFPSRC